MIKLYNILIIFLFFVFFLPHYGGTDEKTEMPAKTQNLPVNYEARNKGRMALQDGFYKTALKYFEKYNKSTHSLNPAFCDATILIIKACIANSDPDAATSALKAYEEKSNPLKDQKLKNQLLYWTTSIRIARQQYKEAIPKLTTLLSQPISLKLELMTINSLLKCSVSIENWQYTQKIIKHLLKKFPKTTSSFQAQLILIKINIIQKQIEEAEKLILKLKKTKNTEAQIKLSLFQTLIYVYQKDEIEALKIYKQIKKNQPLGNDPDWFSVTDRLGDLLIENKKTTEALQIKESALKFAVTPKQKQKVLLQLANLWISQKKIPRSIDVLEKYKKNYPDSPAINNITMKLAKLLKKTKSYITAIEYFNSVVLDKKETPEKRYEATIQKAQCTHLADQPENAVKIFEYAGTLLPKTEKQALAIKSAAEICAENQNFKKAAEYYGFIADNLRKTKFAESARFYQAMILQKGVFLKEAISVYKIFLDEFPASKLAEDASFNYARSLKRLKNYKKAVDIFLAFPKQFPYSPKIPKALTESAKILADNSEPKKAVIILSKLIEKYPQSNLIPYALYLKICLNFALGNSENAISDADSFSQKYPDAPHKIEIIFRKGDYYMSVKNYNNAKNEFLKIVDTQPDHKIAPDAFYEAILCLYHMKNYNDALTLIDNFRKIYKKKNIPEIKVKITFLEGDIYSEQNQLTSALKAFIKAAENAEEESLNSVLAYGRAADVLYIQGPNDSLNYEKAVKYYLKGINNKRLPANYKDQFVYKLARTYTFMQKEDDAIDLYFDLIYDFDSGISKGLSRSQYYYKRAVFELGKLLIDNNRFHEAARIYEKIAKMSIPEAEKAKEKAEEIRKTHNLSD
ncbi:MAG: tetratricopeptide repeat protein [Verrucomicrobiota bacterium]|nr:tetratricopeptide repeat protein [Verrucomicrobiota bacterium]